MGVLPLLCALAALIWAIHLIRLGNLPLAGLAILLVGTVCGPAFFALNGPVQISADRVLWGLVLVMLGIHWRLGKTDFGALSRGDWCLLFLVAWLAISTQRGGPVPGDASPFARWLFYIFMPLGMYWVARGSKLQPRDMRWILNALVGLAVYLAVTGWCEMRGWHAVVFPKYIVDPKIWEFYGRARGPLLNPAANGILLTLGWGAAMLQWLQAGRLGKALYGLAVLVIALGLYATLTRGVWVGGALALAILAYHHLPRWLSIVGLVCVLLISGGAAIGLKDQLLRLKRDKNLSAAEAEKSLQLRPVLAIVAFEMFKDKPITGFGYGHYFAHSGPYHDTLKYGSRLSSARPYMQHNVLLSILVDSGLVGLLPLVFLLLYWSACGWKLVGSVGPPTADKQLGLLMLIAMGSYLVNGMFQDVSIIPMVHMFLFYLAGLTVGTWQRASGEGDVANVPRPSPRQAAVAKRVESFAM